MKTWVIKIIGFVLLAGFIATGCERRYYIGEEHHRHHDHGLHIGHRHDHD
jgi:hypothetical protein